MSAAGCSPLNCIGVAERIVEDGDPVGNKRGPSMLSKFGSGMLINTLRDYFIYMGTSYKGRYAPKNPIKYAGDPSKIIYRSLWERKFMVFCDTNPSVIKWASEEISIPYFSPIDNEYHQYYPDFTIKVKGKTNSIKTYLIEIKPEKQCREPEKKKKSNKT